MKHKATATSFADPADILAFKKCKAQGMSDKEAFQHGDNGIGCWGDSTVEGTGPSCALSPEAMTNKWGSIKAAKHKKVTVWAISRVAECVLKDRLPHNSTRIDLNPDACAKLGLVPPVKVSAEWEWVT